MTEELISELRKLLDANQYEEVINFCNQKLAISDSENFDNFTLAKVYCISIRRNAKKDSESFLLDKRVCFIHRNLSDNEIYE